MNSIFSTAIFGDRDPQWPANDAALRRCSRTRAVVAIALAVLLAGAPIVLSLFDPIQVDASMVSAEIVWAIGVVVVALRQVMPETLKWKPFPASDAPELEDMMKKHEQVKVFVETIVLVRKLRLGDLLAARDLERRCLRAIARAQDLAALDRIQRGMSDGGTSSVAPTEIQQDV